MSYRNWKHEGPRKIPLQNNKQQQALMKLKHTFEKWVQKQTTQRTKTRLKQTVFTIKTDDEDMKINKRLTHLHQSQPNSTTLCFGKGLQFAYLPT